MSAPDDRHRSQPPSVREVADLVARLRDLTRPDTSRDPAKRAAFLADKDALLARIPTDSHQHERDTPQSRDAQREHDVSTEDSPPEHFVPRFGSDPAAARYETMSPQTAVERIAAVGFDRADAEHMVAEYLREGTARHGEPSGGWRVDPYDLAEIARQWEWVDHYRGETIATARERAAEDAAGWRQRASGIDAERDPHGAQRAQKLADEWQARASTGLTVSAAAQDPAADGLHAVDLDPEDLAAEDLDGAEQEVRREQLNRWHDTGPADADDHVIGISIDDSAGDSAGDDAYGDGGSGWDR